MALGEVVSKGEGGSSTKWDSPEGGPPEDMSLETLLKTSFYLLGGPVCVCDALFFLCQNFGEK